MSVTKALFAGAVDGSNQSVPIYIKMTDNLDGTCSLNLGTIATATAPNSYTNITTATTTIVKASAGVLDSIIINSLGTVASTITIYDSATATGTKIGTINSLAVLGALRFNVTCANGLTIVTTGTVAPDVTVCWR